MKYLLDVNGLIALGFFDHVFHERVAAWARTLAPDDELVTSPSTELGFVRIMAQVPQYAFTVKNAVVSLSRMKKAGNVRFSFVPDDQDVSRLPSWANTPKQVMDGHLTQLAKANGAVLATLDRSIPGAFQIP